MQLALPLPPHCARVGRGACGRAAAAACEAACDAEPRRARRRTRMGKAARRAGPGMACAHQGRAAGGRGQSNLCLRRSPCNRQQGMAGAVTEPELASRLVCTRVGSHTSHMAHALLRPPGRDRDLILVDRPVITAVCQVVTVHPGGNRAVGGQQASAAAPPPRRGSAPGGAAAAQRERARAAALALAAVSLSTCRAVAGGQAGDG